jgi:TonB-linked SusC/RagA family outer membrane protein
MNFYIKSLYRPRAGMVKILLVMKLIILLLTTAILQVSANSFAQKLTMSKKNVSLKEVFKEITKQTGYEVFYFNTKLNDAKTIDVNYKNTELVKVLNDVIAGDQFSYTIDENLIVIKVKEPSFLDKVKSVFVDVIVRGRIVDEQGKPLPNASIRVKGRNAVTNTNQNGEFEIKDIDEDAVLLVSYVGFKTLEIALKNAVMPLEIKLNLATGELEEVNVTYSTGYQVLKKEGATGAVEVIGSQKINEVVGTDLLSRLPLMVNSLSVVPKRLTVGKDVLLLRGSQTLTGPTGPLIVLDNFPYEGDLNNINPNDIENITLLKDASAASIWGAKAGNGVIVITTKKGRFNQKIRAEVSSSLNVISKPDLFYPQRTSSSEYIDFETFLFSNGYYDADLQNQPHLFQTPVVNILQQAKKNLISETDAAQQIAAFRNKDYRNDLNKYIYNEAINQQYAVSLSGGSNDINWALFAGFDQNKSHLNADYNRGNFRFTNTYKPFSQLTISAAVNFTYIKQTSGKVAPNENTLPYSQLIDENGNQLPFYPEYSPLFIDTAGHGKLLDWNYYPLQDYKLSVANNTTKSVLGSVGINYSIISGLNLDLSYRLELQQLRGRTSHDANSYFARSYINSFSTINNATQEVTRPVPLGGILSLKDNDITSHDVRAQINWKKTWGQHDIIVVIGSDVKMTATDNSANRLYGYNDNLMKGVVVDYLKTYPRFISNTGSGFILNELAVSKQNKNIVGQYAHVIYTFNGKYTLSASGRKDAANLLGVNINDKWKPFWSAGIGWDISKEKFYNVSWLSYLKLRGSYGYSGNMLPNATSLTTLFYGGYSEFTRAQIAYANSFLNPNLKWEKIGTTNLGLEFKLAEDRVSGSVDYYRKKGTDLYDWVKIDRTLGLERDIMQRNGSSIQGSGIEMDLNSVNLNGKLRWTTDLKLNHYNEKIVEAYNPTRNASNYVDEGTILVGKPRYVLFSYKWAGLDPENGDPRGYLNGKISKNYQALYEDSTTVDDLVYKGSVMPTWYGSLGNTFSYKNLSLTARLTYALGYYFKRPTFDYNTSLYTTTIHEDFSRRWKQPGDEKHTNVPSLDYNGNYYRDLFYTHSEVLATRGDHIRLQYINLSYTLHKKALKKMPFTSLRLSAIANDVGILWRANKFGIDPTAVDAIPTPKSFALSLNANF